MDTDCASRDDKLRDAWDSTAVLDFNLNSLAERANIESVNCGPELENLLRKIHDVTSPPRDSSHGEASPLKGSLGGALPEI